MNATKLDLCNRVAKKMDEKTIAELKTILECFLNEILQILSEGKRIEIRGFGCFNTKVRKKRVGRNPRTGQEVLIPKYIAPFFKFSREAQKIFENLNRKTVDNTELKSTTTP